MTGTEATEFVLDSLGVLQPDGPERIAKCVQAGDLPPGTGSVSWAVAVLCQMHYLTSLRLASWLKKEIHGSLVDRGREAVERALEGIEAEVRRVVEKSIDELNAVALSADCCAYISRQKWGERVLVQLNPIGPIETDDGD